MEFLYITLLGDEYSVDFLASREGNHPKVKATLKVSSLEEGLHFLF